MHPKKLSIEDFNYVLPENRIARYPVEPRDSSKLLIFKDGKIEEAIYQELPHFLPENTLLVFNNTKVVEARLLFEKSTGGTIEIFCLEPAEIYADITTAMLQKQRVLWKCLVGGAKKWKEEWLVKQLAHSNTTLELKAKIQARKNDYFIIEFVWSDEVSFAEILHQAGIIPLPPYLNRAVTETDKQSYQTVYAVHNGSVAAPTAGLHFTDDLLNTLTQKNIQQAYITLHVGAGTFKPVKADKMEDHEMHAEFIDVSRTFIQQLIQHKGKTVATGTTSLRTIETLYWMGVKLKHEIENGSTIKLLNIEDIAIKQWDAYELPQDVSKQLALQVLVNWMIEHDVERIICKTQIIIAPGYQLKIADGILTNFHQPKSTLLLLIAAVIGNSWKQVYTYALEHDFRFLSYGDGSLLWKNYE